MPYPTVETTIKYTIIKNREQYNRYCGQLEDLLSDEINTALQDEIDLLTLLIEKYDEEHNTFRKRSDNNFYDL